MTMITRSAKETVALAKDLARQLSKGDIVALYGDLGSGKTTFTKGIGEGLGVKDAVRINSPTFVLIKEYAGRLPLYHLDLYRLDNLQEIGNIGVEEYMYGDGIAVIEWAEKAQRFLPEKYIAVKFKIKGENKREIDIRM